MRFHAVYKMQQNVLEPGSASVGTYVDVDWVLQVLEQHVPHFDECLTANDLANASSRHL